MWKSFHSCQASCQQLFTIWDTLDEQIASSNAVFMKSVPDPIYILEPESCLLSFVTPELAEAVISPAIPQREYLMSAFQKHIQDLKENVESGNVNIYCSVKGIKNFLQTGKLSEFPEQIYRPLTIAERIEVLERMLPQCQNGHIRLVKEPFENLSLNFHFLIGSSTGCMYLSNVKGNNAYLYFNESSMISIFYDYIRSLDETYLYSGKDTVRAMEELIFQCQNEVEF